MCVSPLSVHPTFSYLVTTSPLHCEGCDCGVKRQGRIVGGVETEVNEYPWMVALADNGGQVVT